MKSGYLTKIGILVALCAAGCSSSSSGNSGKTVTVLICTDSGKLAGPYCPSTEERTYPAGQQPHSVCTIHKAPKHG